MKLYVMRHAYTNLNEAQRVQGRIDVPLSNNGISLAHEIWSKIDDVKVDVIATSPLLRATQTAMIAATYIDYKDPITVIQQFVERDFGILENMMIKKAKSIFAKTEDIENYENNTIFEQRILKGIHILFKHYEHKKVLLFAHSHVMKAILKLSTFKHLDYIQTSIDHQSIIEFNVSLESINYIQWIKKGKS